ncbi:type II secretion system protein M [Gilvimarinus agarilyticus]|uniref:type II secretion system protein GspM n=1 Tax=unclassified Gilvimarinus TaxID=2642066 RepID=UPI001C0A638B|nr:MULTISPECIES: type II secretion system protein M [unclassified Gilvimarinus]MBU2886241.1 type II secretion system protein M [Gilvimarinus agarilyticus]MDO6570929.1 type II secretion system protein M [Gilvimarinus sp. 2_MG-2023]MDO6747784.1 type II secretion system protein M [Gilvimarinus sp. 1_MG-2023]
MNKVFATLAQYNRREQTILLVGALAVVLYILWMAVLSPLQDKRTQQIATNANTSASLERVKLMTAQIKQAQSLERSANNSSGTNISQLIDSTLQSNGLRMSGFQPGTRGEVRVRLDNVNYTAIMQWLYDLEYRHEVTVKDLSMAATSTAGKVTANIRLSKD